MFSKSGTNTPNPGASYNKVQYHEQLDETITWIKDWYSPNLSIDLSEDPMNDAVRLKGWYKTNINHKSHKHPLNYNPVDALDLNEWRYYKESEQTEGNSNNNSSGSSNDGGSTDGEMNGDNMDVDKDLGAAIRCEDQFA